MRIAILSEWFSEAMGYSDNCLPKALAAAGAEVHLITTTAQPYYYSPFYAQTYEPFIGPGIVEPVRKELDGYQLHRLPLINLRGRLGVRGLAPLLRELRPDVVQVTSHVSLEAAQAAALQPRLGFPMFTANHVVASVFPPKSANYPHNRVWRWKLRALTTAPGSVVARRTTLCYAATVDAASIATTFFGVPSRKVVVAPLGVDTDLFNPGPPDVEERLRLCGEVGIPDDGVLCIYTGRFSPDKDPACLARAIGLLRAAGEPYGALFVGDGAQRAEIAAEPGCVVRPFAPFKSLPPLYASADIGVWPRQESISMLDASASGLPVVVSERVRARERVDGVGMTYREGDSEDLARVLIELRSPERRSELGSAGTRRINNTTSWRLVAERRLRDYERALAGELRP